MRVRLLVAAAENDVIGRDGDLPWYLPGDLRRFASLTRGHAVVMGRSTHESILARRGSPLPGRLSVVLSPSLAASAAPADENLVVVATVDAAREAAQAYTREHGREHWFVVGGARTYAAFLPEVDVVDLTRVGAAVDGDAVMPAGWLDGFALVADEPAEDDRADHPYRYLTYERATEQAQRRAPEQAPGQAPR